MQEDEGRVAPAADLADNFEPIVGPEGLLHGLSIGFAGEPERLKKPEGLPAEVGAVIGR